ncbi:hypothetical protein BHM03_00031582 [Ensete ventricosum]|nr:hypothetical protein BHM03_00031582 [Ensete ventricosum]
MAVAKGNNGDPLYNCYKVPGLSDPILETPQISYLEDRYALCEELGWGQFGVIRACSDMLTGESAACKSIAKDRLVTPEDIRSIKLEIEVMAWLSGHPNVVDLKAVYEDNDYVHIVMELCAGGELFDRLEKHGCFPECEAAVLFRHLMEVVVFCHDKGVVHRDLKPENILMATNSLSSPIKLADFGLATYIKPGISVILSSLKVSSLYPLLIWDVKSTGESLSGTVGSPFYIAPEVLTGGYNEAADVWSAGVILYILLSGMPPFWGKTKSKIFESVRSAELRFPSDPWRSVSDSAKELIRGMLCRDPAQRLTAKQVIAGWRWPSRRLLPVTGTPYEFPGSIKDAARQMAQPLETGAREEQEDKHCVVSVDLFGLRNLLIDSGGDSLGKCRAQIANMLSLFRMFSTIFFCSAVHRKCRFF